MLRTTYKSKAVFIFAFISLIFVGFNPQIRQMHLFRPSSTVRSVIAEARTRATRSEKPIQIKTMRGTTGYSIYYRDKVVVLMFHDIDPVSKGGDIITPQKFSQELDGLMARGMHFISLEQFRQYMAGGSVPDNAALVTFDDGYESFYKYAYPIMKQRSIGGVCFVITGDFSKNADVYIPHMTAKEITDMVDADPDIEVQAHTDSLHYKTDRRHDGLTAYLVHNGVKETKAQHLQRIDDDTKLSITKLKMLNIRQIDTFAYPYGLYTPTAIKVLRSNGIRYAFTVQSGLATRQTDPMLLPRINGGSPSLTSASIFRSIMRSMQPDQPNHLKPKQNHIPGFPLTSAS